MSYLMRVCTPSLLTQVGILKRFDEQVLAELQALQEIEHLTPFEQKQVSMPIKKGGLGLRRCEEVTHHAFLASLCQSISQVLSRINKPSPTAALASSDCPRIKEAKAVHTTVLTCLSPIAAAQGQLAVLHQVVPEDFSDFITLYAAQPSKGLQHHLTASVDSKNYKAIMDDPTIDAKDKKRLSCLSTGTGPGVYLRVLPTDASRELTNQVFNMLLRIRLGRAPTDTFLTSHPKCGGCGKDNSVEHVNTCLKLRKTTLNTRHDTVAASIKAVCLRQGIYTMTEPHIPVSVNADAKQAAAMQAAAAIANAQPAPAVDPIDQEQEENKLTQKRADLRVALHPKDLYIDVAILCPTAPTYTAKPIQHNLSVRESQKIEKYRAATGTFVHPMVFSTFGNHSKYVDKVLKRIKPQAVYDSKNFMRHARASISMSLHRAVAQNAIEASTWIRSQARRA
jgi:hypothetical protein